MNGPTLELLRASSLGASGGAAEPRAHARLSGRPSRPVGSVASSTPATEQALEVVEFDARRLDVRLKVVATRSTRLRAGARGRSHLAARHHPCLSRAMLATDTQADHALGVSVFEIPQVHVKGRKRSRVVVCSSVAQSVIEAVRGQHPTHVFVWRRERRSNLEQKPAMSYRAIEAMNNTAWQRARAVADLGDLHVYDLRQTIGMRLREAGVSESTVFGCPLAHDAIDDSPLQRCPDRRIARRTGGDQGRLRTLEQEPRDAETRTRWAQCGSKSRKSPAGKKNGLRA